MQEILIMLIGNRIKTFIEIIYTCVKEDYIAMCEFTENKLNINIISKSSYRDSSFGCWIVVRSLPSILFLSFCRRLATKQRRNIIDTYDFPYLKTQK